jgi:8-oxo-dGTP pyrophosphatase MutT (NUDIX family)
MVEEQDNNQRVFNQPAGHLEPDETLLDAAIRETLEETGWRVTLDGLIGVYQYYSEHNDTTYLRFCFAASAIFRERENLDSDIIAAHWLSREQIAGLPHRSPLVMQCLKDFIDKTPVNLSRIQNFLSQ